MTEISRDNIKLKGISLSHLSRGFRDVRTLYENVIHTDGKKNNFIILYGRMKETNLVTVYARREAGLFYYIIYFLIALFLE